MLRKVLRASAFWSLADQGIVSVGNFAVTLLLARLLVPAEYGVYSLLLLLTLALQTITSSLLFYPLTVRGTVLPADERAELFGRGLVLVGLLSIPLALVLAGVLGALAQPALIFPAIAWLVLGQVKELLRRVLLAELRYIAAVPGDVVCFLGQAVCVWALAHFGILTLAGALGVMTATAVVASLLQVAVQVTIRPSTAGLWQTVRQCWGIGGFSLGSNLLATLRFQVFPWALATLGGTVLAAHFQAAQNLLLAVNPVLLGLCNVIPQVAARGRQEGGATQALRAARDYMLMGGVLIFAYYLLLLLWPRGVLALLYGAASPYVELTLAVRIMTVAALIAYGADMICSYLHGLESAKQAMKINMVGLIASLVLGLPVAVIWGLIGSCVGLLVASVVRSVVAVHVLIPLLRRGRAPPRALAVLAK